MIKPIGVRIRVVIPLDSIENATIGVQFNFWFRCKMPKIQSNPIVNNGMDCTPVPVHVVKPIVVAKTTRRVQENAEEKLFKELQAAGFARA